MDQFKVTHTKCYGEKAYTALAFLAYTRSRPFYVIRARDGVPFDMMYYHNGNERELYARQEHIVLAPDDEVCIMLPPSSLSRKKFQEFTSRVLRAAAKAFIIKVRVCSRVEEDEELYFIPHFFINDKQNVKPEPECMMKLLKLECEEDWSSIAGSMERDFHVGTPYIYKKKPIPLRLEDFIKIQDCLKTLDFSMARPLEAEMRKTVMKELYSQLEPIFELAERTCFVGGGDAFSNAVRWCHMIDLLKCLVDDDLKHGFRCMANTARETFNCRAEYWARVPISTDEMNEALERYFETDSFKKLQEVLQYIREHPSEYPCIRELALSGASYRHLCM